MLVGTLQYMAPEQLEGKEAGARTDIFAFGAIVYEMTAGRRRSKRPAMQVSSVPSSGTSHNPYRPCSWAYAPSARKRQPMGRLGTPEEIAFLALYLGSDESAFTTGTHDSACDDPRARPHGSGRAAPRDLGFARGLQKPRPPFDSMSTRQELMGFEAGEGCDELCAVVGLRVYKSRHRRPIEIVA
jgi:serine/threonine protein kinase